MTVDSDTLARLYTIATESNDRQSARRIAALMGHNLPRFSV